MVCFYNDISIFVTDRVTGETSCNSLLKTLDLFFSIHERSYPHSRDLSACTLTAVGLTNDHMLWNINKTSGQVTGVSRTKCSIGKTFTSTMCGHEVLKYIKTFTEVRLDRQLDRTTGCICHKSTHTGKLFDLFIGTTGSGVSHHEDVVVFIKSG